MSQEIVKFDMNNPISLGNSSDVKEEFQHEYYPENKVWVSESTVHTSNTELNEYTRNDKIGIYEMLSVNHIKTDLASCEGSDVVSNNVKTEDGICPADMQIEFSNEVLFCNHCHEVYQNYCTKCRAPIHILNKIPHNTHNRIRELPKYMLETRESIGHFGIFSLKVIPENVRFGPFSGLNSAGLPLRIKGGRFVVSDDKSELLNWMQYINPARNIYEQNLFPFQYDDKLYYCSTRRIQKGEELLVYFGEEYVDNLSKNTEMDFVPITKENAENVFACTFCCLGFSSKEYLAEHKVVYHGEINKMFSIEELAQCPFCKMYLGAKEYFEHHKDYCCETNARYCLFPIPEIHKLEVKRRSSLRSKGKRWSRKIYKCTQCKFSTMYNADFRHHTNEHYKVKMYKCGICDRRFKAKESLKTHVEKMHADNKGIDVQKYYKCDYFKEFKTYLEIQMKKNDYKCPECEYKTSIKGSLKRHIKAIHLEHKDYECMECEYKTNYKSCMVVHIKTEHLKQSDYKCAECDYQTNIKRNLKRHIKAKHLKQNDYKCAECEYVSNYESCLVVHIKTKHLKQNDYKCAECDFETNYKSSLEVHIKTKHLKQSDYKCAECEYKTNYKSSLEVHVKTEHLKQIDYKCAVCEYKTNYKSSLDVHVKTKHQKQNDYNCPDCELKTHNKNYLKVHIKRKHLEVQDKCAECEYKTNCKSSLKVHIKTKHRMASDYKCTECEYKTNYKPYLQAHIKTKHQKQNDYKCVECEYETNYKPYFIRHIKAKHLKQNETK